MPSRLAEPSEPALLSLTPTGVIDELMLEGKRDEVVFKDGFTQRVSTKPKFLLWSIAFGPRGKSLAAVWLSAIRETAKWGHDVFLLGDGAITCFDGRLTRAIDIRSDVVSRYDLKLTEWSHWTLNNLKAQVLHYVDVARYDYVIYLDIDVLANSERLEQLVSKVHKAGKIAVQKDCTCLSQRKIAALRSLGFPTREEYESWCQRPICAGVMGFPTSPRGLSALNDYAVACEQMRFRYSDQAKLTALLNRHYNDHWEFLGDTCYGRRLTPKYTETLVHFSGQRDGLLKLYAKYHLRQCNSAERVYIQVRALIERKRFSLTRKYRVRQYWSTRSMYDDDGQFIQ